MENSVVKLKAVTAAALCTLGFLAGDALAWQSDRSDGTGANPPLNADYPDPDIIRVGDDFYFVTTTFVNMPGLTNLHSQDLVNWKIVSHVISRFDRKEQYDIKNGTAYRSGVFAASIRYHKGTFYAAETLVGLEGPSTALGTPAPARPERHGTACSASSRPSDSAFNVIVSV